MLASHFILKHSPQAELYVFKIPHRGCTDAPGISALSVNQMTPLSICSRHEARHEASSSNGTPPHAIYSITGATGLINQHMLQIIACRSTWFGANLQSSCVIPAASAHLLSETTTLYPLPKILGQWLSLIDSLDAIATEKSFYDGPSSSSTCHSLIQRLLHGRSRVYIDLSARVTSP